MPEPSFRPPRAFPWLLLGLITVVAGAVTLRYWQRASSGKSPLPDQTGTVAPSPPSTNVEPRSFSPVQNRQRRQGLRPQEAVADPLTAVAMLQSSGSLLEARELCQRLLSSAADEAGRREVEERLGQIHTGLVFSPMPMPEKIEHVVRKGETVEAIARRHGTTPELILRANRIEDPRRLAVGTRLSILVGRFSVRIRRSDNEMELLLNDRFFKRYPVGTGRDGSTPIGEFVISEKEKEPTWWHDGRRIPYGHPENLLGTRWMALQPVGSTPAHLTSYGIHGTWDESSIGRSESAGCIRMRNADVEELFALLPPGTPVRVEE